MPTSVRVFGRPALQGIVLLLLVYSVRMGYLDIQHTENLGECTIGVALCLSSQHSQV